MGGAVPLVTPGAMLLPWETEVGQRVLVRQVLNHWAVAVREKPELYRVVAVLESEALAEILADGVRGTDSGELD